MKCFLLSNKVSSITVLSLALLLQSCGTTTSNLTSVSIETNPTVACEGTEVEVKWVNNPATLSTSSPPADGVFDEELSGAGSKTVFVKETTKFHIISKINSSNAASAITEIVQPGDAINRDYTMPWLGCSNPTDHADAIENTLPSGSRIKSVVNNTNIRISLRYGGRSASIEPSEETMEFSGLPAGGTWQATHFIDELFHTTEGCQAPEAVVLAPFPVDIDISVTAACE